VRIGTAGGEGPRQKSASKSTARFATAKFAAKPGSAANPTTGPTAGAAAEPAAAPTRGA